MSVNKTLPNRKLRSKPAQAQQLHDPVQPPRHCATVLPARELGRIIPAVATLEGCCSSQQLISCSYTIKSTRAKGTMTKRGSR